MEKCAGTQSHGASTQFHASSFAVKFLKEQDRYFFRMKQEVEASRPESQKDAQRATATLSDWLHGLRFQQQGPENASFVHVFVHIYIYVYVYVYIHVFISACICMFHICMYIYIRRRRCISVCMCMYMHTYMYTHMYTHVYMCMFLYTYICKYAVYNACRQARTHGRTSARPHARAHRHIGMHTCGMHVWMDGWMDGLCACGMRSWHGYWHSQPPSLSLAHPLFAPSLPCSTSTQKSTCISPCEPAHAHIPQVAWLKERREEQSNPDGLNYPEAGQIGAVCTYISCKAHPASAGRMKSSTTKPSRVVSSLRRVCEDSWGPLRVFR